MGKVEQRGENVETSAAPETPLSDNKKREQRARLIKALGRFRPNDASPLQFYNCVREVCIMHNCSIDEGLIRAANHWPKLGPKQRELYDSQRHAELPIPVPRHLIYRAFEKERSGLWTLGRSSTGANGQTLYTVEAYKPPPKASKLASQRNANRPKYDNLLYVPPSIAATQSLHSIRGVRRSPASGRRIRSLTPPPNGDTGHNPKRKLRKRRHVKKSKRKSGTMSTKSLCHSSSGTGSTSKGESGFGSRSGSGGSGSICTSTSAKCSKKQKKKPKSKSKKSAKKSNKTGQKSKAKTNWEQAVEAVQKYLMNQSPTYMDRLISRLVD